MDLTEIQSCIGLIENDRSLYEEKNFDKRIEAIDFIEFHVIDQPDDQQTTNRPGESTLLKHRAEKLLAELEKTNINLFEKLRADIRKGEYCGEAFKNMVSEYVDFNTAHNDHQAEPGYDNLDIFINGLTHFQPMPEQRKALEPEMVYYQKTPARIVFELVEKVRFVSGDVFFDLGSGLGQVAIHVNLLAGIKTIGIEFEPAFCDYATDCAAALNLPGVTFINTDARQADYSQGTVFFLYTPFTGEMLTEVLERLRKESLLRKINIITYGPCTAEVALQGWLSADTPNIDNIFKPAVFNSL
jgi:hypothetical protein